MNSRIYHLVKINGVYIEQNNIWIKLQQLLYCHAEKDCLLRDILVSIKFLNRSKTLCTPRTIFLMIQSIHFFTEHKCVHLIKPLYLVKTFRFIKHNFSGLNLIHFNYPRQYIIKPDMFLMRNWAKYDHRIWAEVAPRNIVFMNAAWKDDDILIELFVE